MANALASPDGLDGKEVRTITFGQSIRLDWETLLPTVGSNSEGFSGTLTLHAAGSSMSEHFGLDIWDGRLALSHTATDFYVETFVHVDGACIGSYIDMGIGPYLNMSLRSASCDHLDVLLRRIRFTAASDELLPDRPGPRIITMDLQEQRSGKRESAQILINVVARMTVSGSQVQRSFPQPCRLGKPVCTNL